MDNKAFYSAFNHSASLLQQSARNFAGNMEEAVALYQETAFQISKQKDSVQETGTFKEWAIGIMRSIFLNRLRKKKYQPGTEILQESVRVSVSLEGVLSKLEELEEDCRIPFWNHFMGLSEQEIAAHTGLPVETVKERIALARQQLTSLFSEA